MLRKIHLTNFRQHEDLTLHFENGLVVLRGHNEAGKSTIILGALYALFGARVLPLPVSGMVTWGKPENTLAVELIIDVEGEQYLFKRSAKGAECHYSGGSVTGQTEVTNFASEVLGEDYATVSKLMIANQNNLRGALEEGPTKVAQYIEDLSGMDLFDTILTLAAEKLLTGNTGVFEVQVSEAQDVLDAAVVAEPDFSSFDAEIKTFEETIVATKASLEKVKPEYETSKIKLMELKTNEALRAEAHKQVEVLTEKLSATSKELKEQVALSEVTVDEAHLATLEASLTDAQVIETKVSQYELFNKLIYPADVFWTGTKESFSKQFTETTNAKFELQQSKAALQTEIVTLQKTAAKTINFDTVCPTCGQEFADAEAKKQHIKELQDEIANANKSLTEVRSKVAELDKAIASHDEDLSAMHNIQKASGAFENYALINSALVDVDLNFYPPKLAWRGAIPTRPADSNAVRSEIAAIKAQQRNKAIAEGRVISAREALVKYEADLVALNAKIDTYVVLGLEELTKTTFELEEQVHLATWKISDIGSKIVLKNAEKNAAQDEYARSVMLREDAKSKLDKAKEQLEKVQFNNGLIKKIRAARPIVADMLWSTVLLSVSTMFTQMRGTPSVVTKEKSGFAVNGEPVEGLSGSTLDILGLALRSALVKSFLPHTSMMVLDEPAAAMDEDRALKLLGFIASSGFKQTILITHEDVSEQFADQLITL